MITNISRKNRYLILIMGLLAFPLFFPDTLFFPTQVTVAISGGPPPTGDWEVSSPTDIEDVQYILNGSIRILTGGKLTLTNVTLWLNCASDGEFNITVDSGGELYFHNCTVTAYDTDYCWFLAAKAGSILLFNETTVSYAGSMAFDIPPSSVEPRDAGVWINTNNAEVINCTILRNACGLWLDNANDTLIEDNDITLSACYGIYVGKANNTILDSNSITHSVSCGIWLEESGHSTVSGNTVTNSTSDEELLGSAAIWLKGSNYGTVSGNTITDSGNRGIYLDESGNCNVSGNTVTNSDQQGIRLWNSSQSIVSGNTVTDNKDGISLDESGHSTVSGNTIMNSSPYGTGIFLQASNHSTVGGNTVTNSGDLGIWLIRSGNSTVSGNTVTNSRFEGIMLEKSGHGTVSGNTVTNSSRGRGIYLDDSVNNNIVSGNTLTNINHTGIYLSRSGNNNIVSGNTVTNSRYSGINLWYSGNNNTVSGNTVTNSSFYGIYLGSSGNNNTVSGNNITHSNPSGIMLDSSSNNTIRENTVADSDEGGILVWNSSHSTVNENTATNNHWGINLGYSSHSTVSGNTITNSSSWGISLNQTTSNCLLWRNTLSTNELGNAYDGNGTNQWDNGTHGNWYDDYTGPDLNQDGIGDIPYSIGGGLAEDRYPLMNLVLPDTSSPTLDSPADVTYTAGTTGHTITWHPSDANPFWYQIFRDGTVVVNTTWDGTAITLEVDGLESGTYNYTIVVMDRLGYHTKDEVLVTVESAEEETTEDESETSVGFDLPLIGLVLAVGMFLTRSRRRKRDYS